MAFAQLSTCPGSVPRFLIVTPLYRKARNCPFGSVDAPTTSPIRPIALGKIEPPPREGRGFAPKPLVTQPTPSQLPTISSALLIPATSVLFVPCGAPTS